MSTNPYKTYENMNKESMSPRELEAYVLTKAGVMLKRCQENWSAADRDAKLLEAIKYNQTVWSLFQGELTRSDHPMPLQLREDILNLSLFIDKSCIEAMEYPEVEKLTPIIDINLNLAAGLRAKPEESVYEQAV